METEENWGFEIEKQFDSLTKKRNGKNNNTGLTNNLAPIKL